MLALSTAFLPALTLALDIDPKHAFAVDSKSTVAYELFNIRSIRIGSPILVIKPDGRFDLNADAGDLLRQAGAKFVQIFWDAETSKIALRPLAKSGESSYKLLVRSGKRSTSFSALTFLRYIGWDLSKSATVPVDWNEKEEFLEASLPPFCFVAKEERQPGRLYGRMVKSDRKK
jgi:hypothetical protein